MICSRLMRYSEDTHSYLSVSRAVADEVLRCLFAFIAVVAMGGDIGVSFVETVVKAVLICEHMCYEPD